MNESGKEIGLLVGTGRLPDRDGELTALLAETVCVATPGRLPGAGFVGVVSGVG